jgi:serine protease Do
MSLRSKIAMGSALLLVIVAAVFGFRALLTNHTSAGKTGITQTGRLLPVSISPNFEALADSAAKAVVNINTERIDAAAIRNPFEELFHGDDDYALFDGAGRSKRINLGSGFIVNPDGFLLTNSHVVENASTISVRLYDHRIMKAAVVGTDPKTDLAVLKIQSSHLPILRLAPSDDAAVGEWVAAFGSPFGLEQTMTVGIISAKGRISGPKADNWFLQTDAAINPGNSGGPLVNMRGEVVGVNTAINDGDRAFSGMAFAIPSSVARSVYDQLVKSGKAYRGWIGAYLQEMTPQIARSYGLQHHRGALVSDVEPDGPAAKAGIQPEDFVIEFNGQSIRNTQELSAAVAETKPGSSVQVKIMRNDKHLTLNISVGERASSITQRFNAPRNSSTGRLGIMVENVTSETRSMLQLSSSNGALVVDVLPGSAADTGGVQPGDVIHAIDHSPVYSPSDLLSAMRNLNEDSTVLLRVERRGKALYLAFKLS